MCTPQTSRTAVLVVLVASAAWLAAAAAPDTSTASSTAVSDSNQVETKVQLPGSASGSTAGSQPSTPPQPQPQQQQQLQFTPGQFMPLASPREVAPGHVTMIGYTTPIVKVGDPIPIEQYLKQQHQFQERNALRPLPPDANEQITRFMSHFNQQAAAAPTGRSLAGASESGSVATASTDVPLRLVYGGQPGAAAGSVSSAAQQPPLFDLTQLARTLLLQPRAETAGQLQTAAPVDHASVSQPLFVFDQRQKEPQLQSQPGLPSADRFSVTATAGQQPQQPPLLLQQQPPTSGQFSSPLEKPRPFLVFKPGFTPRNEHQKLLLQHHIQHDLSPTAAAPARPQSALSSSPSLLPVSLEQFRSSQSTGIGPNPNGLLTRPISSLLTGTANSAGTPSLTSSLAAAPKRFEWEQPRSAPISSMIGQSFAGQPSAISPAADSPTRTQTFSRLVKAPETEQSQSSVDTREELHNQIRHVLATSPNLSEDSRIRHRDAIFQAVSALMTEDKAAATGAVGSTAGASQTAAPQPLPQVQPQPPQPVSTFSQLQSQPVSAFPQHHPRSMLFRVPSAQPTVATAPASLLTATGHRAVTPGSRLLSSTMTPMHQQPNLLSRFPSSLLPGFHGIAAPPPPASQSSLLQPGFLLDRQQPFGHGKSTASILDSWLASHQQPGRHVQLQPAASPSQLQGAEPSLQQQQQQQQLAGRIRLAPGLLLSSGTPEVQPLEARLSPAHFSTSAEQQKTSADASKLFLSPIMHSSFEVPKGSASERQEAKSSSGYEPEPEAKSSSTREFSEWWKERALLSFGSPASRPVPV